MRCAGNKFFQGGHMNIFRFLKSTKGAIKLGNAALLVSVASAGVFYIGSSAIANKQIAAQRQIRTSLSSLDSSRRPSGMIRRDGMLTSINIEDSLNQFATPEERAASQGKSALDRYRENQRALGDLEYSLGNMDVGPAADISNYNEGLGTENLDVVQGDTRLSVGNPNVPGGNGNTGNGYEGSRSTGGEGSSGGGNGFTTAPMAHASGSNYSGSSGPGSTAGPSGSGSSAKVPGQEGPRRLSGDMPAGTNIVSRIERERALGLGDGGTTSFSRGRNALKTGRSQQNPRERDELKDILRLSAKAYANPKASANEGGRALLANYTSSNGTRVEANTDVHTPTSSTFLPPAKTHKPGAMQKWKEKEEDKQEERNKKQRELIGWLFGTAVASAGLIIGGAKWLQKIDADIKVAQLMLNAAPTPYAKAAAATRLAVLKAKRKMVAIGLVLAVTTPNTLLFIKAKEFMAKYGDMGGIWWAAAAQMVSVLSVAAAVQTALHPSWKDFIKKTWAHIQSGFKGMVGVLLPKI